MGIFDKSFKPNVKELRKGGDVEGLVEALGHNDWHVRRDAAKTLGEMRDGRAVEPLIKALKDEETEVAFHAAQALGFSFFGAAWDPDEKPWAFDEIKTKKVVESLVEACAKDEKVRAAAVFAIGSIPVPMKLEEGEKVVRKVKGVRISGTYNGSLLLTNQRLILHGCSIEQSFSLELPLAEIVNCEVKNPLSGKKKLLVTARRAVYKNPSELVIEEVATRGYSQPPAFAIEPTPQELTGIEDPEALKSEIIEQSRSSGLKREKGGDEDRNI